MTAALQNGLIRATVVPTTNYTGCPRRKGPNFGRVFLRSNYTDITQNTYIQSSVVTEILVREVGTLTVITHLLIMKYILKLAGICGFCNVTVLKLKVTCE